jgi:hypothetical protein
MESYLIRNTEGLIPIDADSGPRFEVEVISNGNHGIQAIVPATQLQDHNHLVPGRHYRSALEGLQEFRQHQRCRGQGAQLYELFTFD